MQNHYSAPIDFRPAPTPVYGCKHYREHSGTLEAIDDILSRSGLDHIMIERALQNRCERISQEQDRPSDLNKLAQKRIAEQKTREGKRKALALTE